MCYPNGWLAELDAEGHGVLNLCLIVAEVRILNEIRD